MAHPRKTIREKIVTLLSSGVTLAGGRVYDSRTQAVATAPFVIVSIVSDDPNDDDFIGLSTPNYMRVLNVQVACVDTGRPGSGTLAGDADNLARQVEETLADKITLEGLALSCLLSGTTLEESNEVDPPAYQATLTYLVQYSDTLGL